MPNSTNGILVDAYITAAGRTVLFRRYNAAPRWSSRHRVGRTVQARLRSSQNSEITDSIQRSHHTIGMTVSLTRPCSTHRPWFVAGARSSIKPSSAPSEGVDCGSGIAE